MTEAGEGAQHTQERRSEHDIGDSGEATKGYRYYSTSHIIVRVSFPSSPLVEALVGGVHRSTLRSASREGTF
jgi:hypothetical protein